MLSFTTFSVKFTFSEKEVIINEENVEMKIHIFFSCLHAFLDIFHCFHTFCSVHASKEIQLQQKSNFPNHKNNLTEKMK